MKKILIIGTTDFNGGVGNIALNYCMKMDKTKFHFDFLYYTYPDKEDRKIIEKLNSNFFYISRYSKKFFMFIKEIQIFYEKHQYDIIHCHASTATLIMYTMPVWKKSNIIYHSHSNSGKTKLIHTIFKVIVKKYAKTLIAVSEQAGIWMFGKKLVENRECIILKNGINISKYLYDEKTRKKLREKLRIQSKIVIGHVGRFEREKNHTLIIDIFEEVHKKNKETILLLVGEGSYKEKIKVKAKNKGIEKSIIFYGNTNKVAELYQIMDIFLLPSFWEGLGIVAIEAQAAGLLVLASDEVPVEAKVLPSFRYMKLSDTVFNWSERLIEMAKELSRKDTSELIKGAGYDLEETTKLLEHIYNNIN